MRIIRETLNNNKYCKLIKNSSTYKGIVIGWSLELAPPFLIKFQNNIFIRVIRVIGGLSLLLTISNNYLLAPKFIQYIIFFFALIQIIWMFIYYFIKTVYGIYTLIYKKEVFKIKK
uniref:Uncharacterized protein n=1 Tax=Hericium coralloides TaxID=100756 RepID=A0A1P8NNJ3_HERCO|nr:hypothetical protein [Hericium coralloides]APX41096.1 hypothetical protein [Hericium coralloides]